MKRKLFFWVALFTIASLALSGCGSKVTRPIVILASDQPGAADPAENWTFGGSAYLPLVYDSLYRFTGEKAPTLEPLLASALPQISADGLSYTIKLKSNLKFHDGSTVNADAVIYSYDRIKALNKGANGISADWIASTKKIDDTTIEFTLKQPFSDFLNSLGSVWGNYIVNPKVCKDHEKDGDYGYNWLLDHDAGSGPYTMESFDHANNTITLARYKDYWKGWSNSKAPEKAIIRWLADPTQARLMLEKGEADIAVNLPTTDFAALQKASGFSSNTYPSIMQYYLAMNGTVKPLDNAKVRQALQYTFNGDKVISDIFGGNLMKMTSAIGPGYSNLYTANTVYTYDLEKAKALLTEAGYADGFEVTVNVMGFWPNDKAVLEYWQADLAKVGVKLNIQQIDGGTWGDAWWNCTASTTQGIGLISAMAVGADYPSAWELLAQVYPVPRLGGGKCSVDYIDNPTIDAAFTQIATVTDSNARKQLLDSILEAAAQDAGTIWIGQAADLVTMRDVVKGYTYSFAMGGNYVPLPAISLSK
jgi:peptide/nickel transport system substrate-binding protein